MDASRAKIINAAVVNAVSAWVVGVTISIGVNRQTTLSRNNDAVPSPILGIING